jgi:hypothetical protein
VAEVERGWDRDDIDANRRWGAQQVLAVPGIGEPPGVTTILESVRRSQADGNGPDKALIEAGLHLPLDQFEKVEDAVKRMRPVFSTRRRRR